MSLHAARVFSICLAVGVSLLASEPVSAQEWLCDTSFQDCRSSLWSLIDNEPSGTAGGIDVAFWFMQDFSLSGKLVQAHQRGVRVRVIVDLRSIPQYTGTEEVINQLAAAGIPMRHKPDEGILHWKMMLFAGQNKLQFSGANYGDFFFLPAAPYDNYIDEVIYFTDDPALLSSFKTKYDDAWMDGVLYANYANIVEPRTRMWGAATSIDPALNFPPGDWTEDFMLRTVAHLNAETQRIDVVMYRITSQHFADATIEAVGRGVPVRLLHEPNEYRNRNRPWDSWNIDRMYMAGVEIKMRRHEGLNHEKLVTLVGQEMSIFGSSNWTGPSSNYQAEHNYFTTKPWMFNWFVNHFDRKWSSASEYEPFVPLAPDEPMILEPSYGATSQPITPTFVWEGGPWAHSYDIYLGTSPDPPLFASDVAAGSVDEGTLETFT
ncbi:MAG: phospholipase D-like domain-containing protein, partial [Acidimicrobiia bacterium]